MTAVSGVKPVATIAGTDAAHAIFCLWVIAKSPDLLDQGFLRDLEEKEGFTTT